jgi:hypothetical protein
VIKQLFLAREQKTVEKSFFFLWNMKFCFMKRLFYTALEETMSVAGVKQLLTSGGSSPITCVSALYDARQAS